MTYCSTGHDQLDGSDSSVTTYILYCRLIEQLRKDVDTGLTDQPRQDRVGGELAGLTADVAFTMILAAAAPLDDFASSKNGSSLAAASLMLVLQTEV